MLSPGDVVGLPVEEYGFPGLRDALVGAIRDGRKRSTTSLVVQYQVDEGEGYQAVADWRVGHEKFWHSPEFRAVMRDPAFTVSDSTEAVLVRFRVPVQH